MPLRALVLNPPAVAVREYSPGCRNGTLNSPFAFVAVVRVSPVLICLTATWALGIRAPEGSSTDPDIVPVEICAECQAGSKYRKSKRCKSRFDHCRHGSVNLSYFSSRRTAPSRSGIVTRTSPPLTPGAMSAQRSLPMRQVACEDFNRDRTSNFAGGVYNPKNAAPAPSCSRAWTDGVADGKTLFPIKQQIERRPVPPHSVS